MCSVTILFTDWKTPSSWGLAQTQLTSQWHCHSFLCSPTAGPMFLHGALYCTITYSHSHMSVCSIRPCRLYRTGALIHLCSSSTPEHHFYSINKFPRNHSGIPVIPKYTMELSDSAHSFPSSSLPSTWQILFFIFSTHIFTLKAQEVVEMPLFLWSHLWLLPFPVISRFISLWHFVAFIFSNQFS